MKKYISLIVIIVLGLAACKKERPVLNEPGNKLDGINANWELVEVIQVDEASISKDELDVSDIFLGNPLKIDINSTDFTYSVDNTSGPNYFGVSGTWEFDDNEFPTKVTFTTSTSKVIDLPLVTTIRPQDTYLNFKIVRKCGGDEEAYVGYKFKFIRAN